MIPQDKSRPFAHRLLRQFHMLFSPLLVIPLLGHLVWRFLRPITRQRRYS